MNMHERKVLRASGAPAAIGPYSIGIRASELVFASGNIGIDPANGELVAGGIRAETRRALENLQAVLKAGGSDLSLVVKTTVFLADIEEYGAMNEVYAEFFAEDPPARSAVEVAALPKGAAVEIEAIALVKQASGD